MQTYAVPINSILYIWTLTLLMASVATLVFLGLNKEESGADRLRFPPAAGIWLATLAGIVLTLVAGFAIPAIPHHLLPALTGTLIGIGYGAHGLSFRQTDKSLFACAWWLLAGFLFLLELPSSLLALAFGILLLIAVPESWKFIRKRRMLRSLSK
ncbi:hypothetical protein [Coraliomargarita parva]|uniref:hypothetical protein n=1 Tax=Coraliomargarita parva TaxID=3014050 RepID=UPI0022B44735|nr:hypothetical protein [Coraliomargarita parva]